MDTILFGTLIGDLGDVLLSQASSNPVICNTGYWNDSMLPRTFYLDFPHWDLTEAEILGGIDGNCYKLITNIHCQVQLAEN